MTDTTAGTNGVEPEAPETAARAEPASDSVAALIKETADLKDRLLRTLAEMENLRRRTEREVADARTYGVTSFARDILAVADNMERALKADFALIKAWKADRWGNLVFRKTTRNFNPMMATAARVTIVEVEHLVEPGEIDADQVHLPSIYVKRILLVKDQQKKIEKRTVRKRAS